MRHNVLTKVYGSFSQISQQAFDDIAKAGASAIGNDMPWLSLDDMETLHFSFEGIFFPEEEVIDALSSHLNKATSGIIDVIDVEAWTITRRHWKKNTWEISCRNLNDVLASYGF